MQTPRINFWPPQAHAYTGTYTYVHTTHTQFLFIQRERKKVGWLEEGGGRNTGNKIKEAGIKFPFFN